MLSSINADFCQLFEMPLHDFTSYEVESYKNISAISASISDFQSTKLRLTQFTTGKRDKTDTICDGKRDKTHMIYNWEAW